MRLCDVKDCGRKYHARGWCIGHYVRWRDTGDARPDVPLKVPQVNRSERRRPVAAPTNFDLDDTGEL